VQVTGDVLQCYGETHRRTFYAEGICTEIESCTFLRNFCTVTREPQFEDENSPRYVTSVCSVTSPKLLLDLPDRQFSDV
jgi:hypothetical protein